VSVEAKESEETERKKEERKKEGEKKQKEHVNQYIWTFFSNLFSPLFK
jgi:hypothetical protein